jgi:hypothetical protein
MKELHQSIKRMMCLRKGGRNEKLHFCRTFDLEMGSGFSDNVENYHYGGKPYLVF